MLMGTVSHSLDAKGRLIIPAAFRKTLGEGFVLARQMEKCLILYPESEWNKLVKKINALPKISSKTARDIRRFFFGNSVIPELDKQGRILIPPALRNYAGLTKDVTLIGIDDHVEIWDSATWNRYNDEGDLGQVSMDLEGIDL